MFLEYEIILQLIMLGEIFQYLSFQADVTFEQILVP